MRTEIKIPPPHRRVCVKLQTHGRSIRLGANVHKLSKGPRLAEILRQGFDYELQLDNVDFVLNAVDLLAGDEQIIDLRNHEAHMRPLTEIPK